jgi:hypothetical protein
MDFKENDKVTLMAGQGISDKPGTPIWGGKYGHIVGTVIKQAYHDGHDYVTVEWSNGRTNELYAYRFRKLSTTDQIVLFVAKTWGSLDLYKKYFGLVMLVVVIDYFFLSSRLKNRLKDVASNFVNKILGLPADVIEGDKQDV